LKPFVKTKKEHQKEMEVSRSTIMLEMGGYENKGIEANNITLEHSIGVQPKINLCTWKLYELKCMLMGRLWIWS
jgi:hypothetical protein